MSETKEYKSPFTLVLSVFLSALLRKLESTRQSSLPAAFLWHITLYSSLLIMPDNVNIIMLWVLEEMGKNLEVSAGGKY